MIGVVSVTLQLPATFVIKRYMTAVFQRSSSCWEGLISVFRVTRAIIYNLVMVVLEKPVLGPNLLLVSVEKAFMPKQLWLVLSELSPEVPLAWLVMAMESQAVESVGVFRFNEEAVACGCNSRESLLVLQPQKKLNVHLSLGYVIQGTVWLQR